MTKSIRVLVHGAAGKMGQVSCNAINNAADMTLVAGTDRSHNLAQSIQKYQPDVVIDFTLPDVVMQNALTIINAGKHPVIGATGLSPQNIAEIQQHCKEKKLGGIIAPNFSIAAILMMHAAQACYQHYPNCEIIETHHPGKVDAPSGTALKTAQLMSQATTLPTQHQPHPARGELHHGIPIHSLRLPGYFAHQQIIFGGPGETLTLTHDCKDRQAMMPGLRLACRQVIALTHCLYGLESLVLTEATLAPQHQK